jgi:hypothetical protein
MISVKISLWAADHKNPFLKNFSSIHIEGQDVIRLQVKIMLCHVSVFAK